MVPKDADFGDHSIGLLTSIDATNERNDRKSWLKENLSFVKKPDLAARNFVGGYNIMFVTGLFCRGNWNYLFQLLP